MLTTDWEKMSELVSLTFGYVPWLYSYKGFKLQTSHGSVGTPALSYSDDTR